MAKSLADEYDLGDDLDSPFSEAVGERPLPEDAPRERDEAGRFKPVSAPEQKSPQHSHRLVQRGIELGLSQEEIDSFTPQELREAIRDEIAMQSTRNAAASTSTADLPKEKSLEDRLIPEGTYEDGLNATLNFLLKEVDALRRAIPELQRHVGEQANETRASILDRAFSELNNPERYGDNPGRALDKSSPELRRRMAIINEALALAGDGADAYKVVRFFKKAEANLYGSGTKPAQPSEKEAWEEGSLAAPTHRSESTLERSREKAVQALRARNGKPPKAPVANIDDDLP